MRLREHAVRPGHTTQRASGHAAGDAAARGRIQRRGLLHAAGGSAARPSQGRTVPGGESRLRTYEFQLRDILRRAAHTLSDAEEKLLADAQPLAASAYNIYGILANADFPCPTITLNSGRVVKVDQARYAELRTSHDRHDRQAAMSAFFQALGSFGRTFGTTMNSNIQKALFYAKARNATRRWNRRSTARTFRSRFICGSSRASPGTCQHSTAISGCGSE